ncbi:divergent polysaccharide deacetylase family protein [Pseudoalteromonas sp. T1lg88]|uniref:divergent polysaccharide deacetylase family protein n=1 Tax=Pseudoalteromonas sp. T1lg88 TaxID=2077104 RepID=UPI001F464BF1|nr:divergent polysaccharide deacetylase family protein [Pseudoalteromonas sp. T1lg88]
MHILKWIAVVVLLACLLASPSVQAKQVAIVIDDIGYQRHDLSALNIPGQLTFAILPFTPYAARFATQANEQQKEIMLHAPMQSLNDLALGPGALTMDMPKEDFQSRLKEALSSLPNIKGVNNHMGSLLTQQNMPMNWTMEVLKEQKLYFLDSKTTPHSKAQSIASLYGVENIARHVFLDNITSEKQLRFRFDQLKRIAKKHDYAVAIAHPYPETFAFLQSALDELKAEGIELVPLSQLVQERTLRLAQAKSTKTSE